MKFQTPKSDDLMGTLVNGGSALGGLMVPNAVANAYAKVTDESIVTEDQKKKKLIVNAGFAIVGLALLASVKGSDTTANAVRYGSAGLIAGGGKEVVKHFFAPKVQAMQAGTTKTLIAGALGCPCQETQPTYRALQMPSSLRMTDFQPQTQVFNSLERNEDIGSNPLG